MIERSVVGRVYREYIAELDDYFREELNAAIDRSLKLASRLPSFNTHHDPFSEAPANNYCNDFDCDCLTGNRQRVINLFDIDDCFVILNEDGECEYSGREVFDLDDIYVAWEQTILLHNSDDIEECREMAGFISSYIISGSSKYTEIIDELNEPWVSGDYLTLKNDIEKWL